MRLAETTYFDFEELELLPGCYGMIATGRAEIEFTSIDSWEIIGIDLLKGSWSKPEWVPLNITDHTRYYCDIKNILEEKYEDGILDALESQIEQIKADAAETIAEQRREDARGWF